MHIWDNELNVLVKVVHLDGYIIDSSVSADKMSLIVPTSPLNATDTYTYAINLVNHDVGMINQFDGDYTWFFPFKEFAVIASKKDHHILKLSW